MLLTIIFLFINFSIISLAILFLVIEILHPKKIEESPHEEEEQPNFPMYAQYSLGFSFLALGTLALMSTILL